MTRLAVLLTHPVQYYSPWFTHLAQRLDLHVFYALRQTPQGQASAGFGVPFSWDLSLLDGYEYTWLENVAPTPGLRRFADCDTPDIGPLLSRGGYDALLIYGWNRKCYWQGLLAAHAQGIPAIFWLDSQLGGRQRWWRLTKAIAYRVALPRLGHYAYPGERSRQYLSRYGVPPNRRHYVPHMVDTKRIARAAARARTSGQVSERREALSTESDAFVILFVGKFIEKKRPRVVLEAVAALRRISPGHFQRATVWFVGDGPLRSELEAQVHAQGLPVTFLGFVNQLEIPAVYASADLLVLPSNVEETWGLVVNEAFAAGVPAVTSDAVGCSPDLITRGLTGWCFPLDDVEALACCLMAAMDHPPSPAALERVTAAHSYEAGSRALELALARVQRLGR